MRRITKRPRGRYAWIVGPDGCGKSTVAAAAAERTGSLLLYWRLGALPMAGRLVGKSVASGVNSRPHDVALNSKLKETVRVAYYALDYIVGYWSIVHRTKRRGRSVLVERGWWDMVVDPRRYALRSPKKASRLARLIRKPDLLIIMTADPSVIRARKAELSEDEIARQLGEWGAVSWERTRVVVIDNERPLDAVTSEVASLLVAEPA